MEKPKILRITTVPISLKVLLKGQLSHMNQNGFDVVGVSSQGKDLEDVHNEEQVRVCSLDMTRKISPIKDIKALWVFYKLCKIEKPFIVHSHTPKAGIIGMLGAKLAGVPLRLHTIAGLPLLEATGIKRKILDFVEKFTYSCATKVYPNSVGLCNFILANNYINKEKTKVIGQGSSNGIDTRFFSPENISNEQKDQLKKELNITASDFVFVFVGRLVGDKGINELVQAFSKISKNADRSKSVKLLLIGPLEEHLDPLQPETVQEIKNNPDILDLGFQKDVRPYFAVSDALVFPSYREGFPNVVMQAGAMGLPSIVSDINGCNEIIVEGQNGMIIPVKNSDKLKTAMEKILSDTDLYQKLKINSRPMIQSRYEQSVVWEALLKEYKTLLKENNIDV